MEEDINILEEMIRNLNQHLNSYEEKDCKTTVYDTLKIERECLENVLNRLKEDEAVIKELTEKEKKTLKFLLELKKGLTEELKYNSTKREARLQLIIVDEILEILKG